MSRNDRRNRRAFSKAKRTCPPGHVVAATLTEDGTPVYFHAPVDATDDDMRRLAFQHRYGRPMNNYEKVFLKNAEQRWSGARHS